MSMPTIPSTGGMNAFYLYHLNDVIGQLRENGAAQIGSYEVIIDWCRSCSWLRETAPFKPALGHATAFELVSRDQDFEVMLALFHDALYEEAMRRF